jgi:hypothetical protein
MAFAENPFVTSTGVPATARWWNLCCCFQYVL